MIYNIIIKLLIFHQLIILLQVVNGYTVQGRFGHTAVQVNDSIYYYGGDSSVSSSTATNQSDWISDLAILPIHSSYQLTDPPWKPASGPQTSVGGPSVYSHVAFMGGLNNRIMIIIGGVMPSTDKITSDEEPTAFSYDLDLGRWNSFSLPSGNHLNRQGAACTTIEHGITYIWGGKRANLASPGGAVNTTRPGLSPNMYRFDSVYPSNSSIIQVDPATPQIAPPLRYAHTQTLISDHRIVVLGGFDGATGDAVSLADVWVFDITSSKWSQINAKLDKENKPANRSSHSQVLMPDGYSILVYGGYDGYHVYNDVAVLDTRTWTWTVKNTNAAVQGRADHTATLVSTNMIVAFGFTGVSTALTVMSDIEVLDIITWSWTSVYTPSPGLQGGTNNNGNGGDTNRPGSNIPTSPSIAIIAGAVTGGLVVFVLILIAFYLLNTHHQKKLKQQKRKNNNKDSNSISSSSTDSSSTYSTPPITSRNNSLVLQQQHEITFKDPPSSTEPFEYYTSRRPSAQIPHPLQINTSSMSPPTRSDTMNTTSTTTVTSSIIKVPSPWSPISSASPTSPASQKKKNSSASTTVNHTDWMIKRAASTPTYHFSVMRSIASISKPDDTFYHPTQTAANDINTLRRAATTVAVTPNNSSNSTLTTNNSSTVTITAKNVHSTNSSNGGDTTSNSSSNHSSSTTNNNSIYKSASDMAGSRNNSNRSNNGSSSSSSSNNSGSAAANSSSTSSSNDSSERNNPSDEDDDVEDDSRFDRQEFILQSDEVEKITEEPMTIIDDDHLSSKTV